MIEPIFSVLIFILQNSNVFASSSFFKVYSKKKKLI